MRDTTKPWVPTSFFPRFFKVLPLKSCVATYVHYCFFKLRFPLHLEAFVICSFKNIGLRCFTLCHALLEYYIYIALIDHGHCEGGRLGLLKNFKTPYFGRYWKFLPRGDSYRSRTSPVFFLFEIFQQIRLLEASKVLAEMGHRWQAVWAMAKIFSSNLCKHMMNKWWKFQEDILILVWVRAKWLKICRIKQTP